MRILIGIILLFGQLSKAASSNDLVIEGKLLKADGTPVEGTNVNFTIEVYSPGAEACLLYKEHRNSLNMNGTQGYFSFDLGSGTRTGSNFEDTSTIKDILSNSGRTPFSLLTCATGNSYTPAPTAVRKVRVTYNDGLGDVVVGSDITVGASAYANYAYSLEGYGSGDFLKVNNSGALLTQSNLESVFSTAPRISELNNLIDGTSTQYMKANPSGSVGFNGQVISGVAAPLAGTDATNKSYVDGKLGGNNINTGALTGADSGKILKWNGSQWIAAATSTIATADLSADAVTSAKILDGTIATADIANLAVTDTKINDLGVDKITSGVGRYFSYAPNGSSCTTGQSLSWNNTSTRWECVTPTVGTITALTGDVTASGPGSVLATISANAVTSLKIQDGTIVDADINTSAAIADTKLATIASSGKVLNSATTATSTNTINSIVARDASGNFSAQNISANTFTGDGSNLTNLNPSALTGTIPITKGGTGATTPAGAINALMPSQTTNNGKILKTDGSNVAWADLNDNSKLPLAGGTMSGALILALGTAGAPGLSLSGTSTGLYSMGTNQIGISINGIQNWKIDSSGIEGGTVGSAYVKQSAGAVTAPTFSFSGDDDTGMFRSAADNLSFSTGGAEAIHVDAAGNVGIGTSNPSVNLDVNGKIRAGRYIASGTPLSAAIDATVGAATGGSSKSLYGRDSASTVGIDTGSSPGTGLLVTVTFKNAFINPICSLTPASANAANAKVYINATTTQYSIYAAVALPATTNGFSWNVICMEVN